MQAEDATVLSIIETVKELSKGSVPPAPPAPVVNAGLKRKLGKLAERAVDYPGDFIIYCPTSDAADNLLARDVLELTKCLGM